MAAEQSDEAAQPQAPRLLTKAARLVVYFALAFVLGAIGFIVAADAYDLSAASMSAVLGWLALLVLAAPIGFFVALGRRRRPHYLVFGLAMLAASAALTFFKGRQEEERIARELQGAWNWADWGDEREGHIMRSWVTGTSRMARFHEWPPELVILKQGEWTPPYVYITIGNSNICPGADGQLRAEMIFDRDPARHAIVTVADIRDYLHFGRDRFWIGLLNASNRLEMRFRDGCGEVRHLEFVIKGQTRF